MRRFKYAAEPVKVLVDIPEEMFDALKTISPEKMHRAVAELAVQVMNMALDESTPKVLENPNAD